MQNDKLETALRLAGGNRPQLELVLDHYAQSPADSLKLRAARFLIENMPGHYTLDGKIINSYRERIDCDPLLSYYSKKVLDVILTHLPHAILGAQKQEDVCCITADYLIHHIDRSFERRESYTWVKVLPFDLFLEYVLPYRQHSERLDYWIDSLQIDSVDLALFSSVDYLKYDAWNDKTNLSISNGDDFDHFAAKTKELSIDFSLNCRFYCEQILLAGKVAAFPSAIDYIPFYANRNGFHYWNISCSPEIRKTEDRGTTERKAAKIYRRVFSRQHDRDKEYSEYIPELFRDPFYKDVTGEYLYPADVSIRFFSNVIPSCHYAYLAVFCDLDWQPIAISTVQHKKVHFSSMGKAILYRPVYFQGREMLPLSFPFILQQDGTVEYLVPDASRKCSLRIERKYPVSRIVYEYLNVLPRVLLVASNDPSFVSVDTLSKNARLLSTRLEIESDTIDCYRYWQFRLPISSTCAEIVFYDSGGQQVKGQVDSVYAPGFDGDPLTNIPVNYGTTNSIVIDFGRPVSISRVVLLPRSDGNGIYPGDDYELFYHDLHGWRSLGRRTATDYYLDYDNLPAGALYWLHNHTRGVEERPFTLTPRGEIRFW